MYELALYYYIIYAVIMVGMFFYSIRLYQTQSFLLNNSKRSTEVALFIALLLLVVFTATGDYWSYRFWYDQKIENIHFEPIWEKIRDLIPLGFDIFKLVLWGGCLYLYAKMCKWANADFRIVFTLFALFYMTNYSYARATIAYMLILFAYCLLIRIKEKRSKNKLGTIVIVAVCIGLGLQMHRSMPLLLAILASSWFLKPSKKTLIGLLLFFIISSIIFNTVLFPYFTTLLATSEDSNRLLEVYSEDAREISYFVRLLFQYLPIVLLFLVSSFNILKRQDSSQFVRKVEFTGFMIVYAAFIFYTLKEGNGLVLFYRTLNMAYPFMLMTIAYSMKYINTMRNLTMVVVVYQVLFTILVMYQILSDPSYLYNQVFERYTYF